jgi:hypothetical protein
MLTPITPAVGKALVAMTGVRLRDAPFTEERRQASPYLRPPCCSSHAATAHVGRLRRLWQESGGERRATCIMSNVCYGGSIRRTQDYHSFDCLIMRMLQLAPKPSRSQRRSAPSVNSSGRRPRWISFQVVGIAIGRPRRARGE